MSQPLFGWPLYSDVGPVYTPAFSGGSWSAGLPLTNLQDERVHRKARSATDSTTDAQFDLDMGVARAGLRIVAGIGHNLSLAGLVRVRLSTVADFATNVYDSGWVAPWENAYPATGLPSWHPSYASLDFTAEDADNYPLGLTFVTPAAVTARYLRWEFDDSSNPDGYLEMGRLVVAPGWQPSYHPDQGAEIGYDTSSRSQETDGGSFVHTDRARRRLVTLRFGDLPQNEAMVSFFEMQRRLGTTRQLFFVFDPEDGANLHRRSLLCYQRQLTALTMPSYGRNTVPVQLVEAL